MLVTPLPRPQPPKPAIRTTLLPSSRPLISPSRQFLDSCGPCGITGLALVYFLLLFCAVIVGVTGPPIFAYSATPATDVNIMCPSPCTASWSARLADFSGFHQVRPRFLGRGGRLVPRKHSFFMPLPVTPPPHQLT